MAVKKTPSVFMVTVQGTTVRIRELHPDSADFKRAVQGEVLRERDAIELFQRLISTEENHDGLYSFHHLDTAKTFSMLFLKFFAEKLEDNLDEVQLYHGG